MLARLSHLAALLALLTLSACDSASDEPAERFPLDLATDDALGSILTDEAGRTLYVFAGDADGLGACAGGCLDAWPVFFAEDLRLASGLDPADVDQITRADGLRQTTYKGWPLYYYAPAGDGQVEAPGSVQGDGVGEVWFVAKPDYAVLLVRGQLVGADGTAYTEDLAEGTGLTRYFTDDRGRTLYRFGADRDGENTFTAPDFSNDAAWPVYAGNGAAPSTAGRSDFGTISVGGRTQLTYKGWPLYFFGGDEGRGDTRGVSQPNPGTFLVVNEATAPAPPSSGGSDDGPGDDDPNGGGGY
ncbi:MAG: hypothetical protein AAGI91_10790 [Bacteroidota bacterium]